jgi:hypothetical protein
VGLNDLVILHYFWKQNKKNIIYIFYFASKSSEGQCSQSNTCLGPSLELFSNTTKSESN